LLTTQEEKIVEIHRIIYLHIYSNWWNY